MLQHTLTHCNTLQHTATHCNILQHTTTHCTTLHHTATLQHPDTHCNTLQNIATHCNLLQCISLQFFCLQHTVTCCNTFPHTATHFHTLQHIQPLLTASPNVRRQHHPYSFSQQSNSSLKHAETRCNTLQHTSTHCNILQHAATHYNIPQHAAAVCGNTPNSFSQQSNQKGGRRLPFGRSRSASSTYWLKNEVNLNLEPPTPNSSSLNPEP